MKGGVRWRQCRDEREGESVDCGRRATRAVKNDTHMRVYNGYIQSRDCHEIDTVVAPVGCTKSCSDGCVGRPAGRHPRRRHHSLG